MRVQQIVRSSTLSFSLVEEMVAMARMAIATLSTSGCRTMNATGGKHSPVATRVGVKSQVRSPLDI